MGVAGGAAGDEEAVGEVSSKVTAWRWRDVRVERERGMLVEGMYRLECAASGAEIMALRWFIMVAMVGRTAMLASGVATGMRCSVGASQRGDNLY